MPVDIIKEILSAIQYGIDENLKNAKFDKTYVGTILQVIDSKTYLINYDNAKRIFHTKHELNLKVMDQVHITYPCNNKEKKFMLEDL